MNFFTRHYRKLIIIMAVEAGVIGLIAGGAIVSAHNNTHDKCDLTSSTELSTYWVSNCNGDQNYRAPGTPSPYTPSSDPSPATSGSKTISTNAPSNMSPSAKSAYDAYIRQMTGKDPSNATTNNTSGSACVAPQTATNNSK